MVVIRLSRGGSKSRPFFNIVVSDKRVRRDGRFIERLGFYNPTAKENEESIRIAQDRLTYWESVGAQASPTVTRLIKQAAAADPKAADRPCCQPPNPPNCRRMRSKWRASPMPGASKAGSRSFPIAPNRRRFS